MIRRLDLRRWGQPFDSLRALRRAWRRRRGDCVGGSADVSTGAILADRVVHVPIRASADSEYAEVFAGIGEFPSLSVYIHGSWADGMMTAFSDYDDLIIVDYAGIRGGRELRRIENFLAKVDMRFCRMDPLQHHGHWIVAREDLAALDESNIPLSVLSGAVCVQGADEIVYRVDVERSQMGFRNNINLTCDGVDALYREYREGRINLYDMKCLTGSFLIIPAYAFQSRGEMISKPDAIRRTGELFGSGACSVIAKCTEIRRTWGRVVDTPQFARFRRVGGIFGNGNLHRRYARALAGRFPVDAFPVLDPGDVAQFVKEARGYANR